ncbi:MAG: MFS transporter [Anaerolineales bacterium]|nr:MFS transporter [Anaerolineales bacterium]
MTTTDKLSRKTKLAYGAGDLGAAIATAINGFFLLNFLINVAGLRPGMAGSVFLIVKIWDAVNDPLIGWLTDRTVSRMGRRRPWLLFAAIPFGLAFFLQWIVPPLNEAGLFAYYLVVAILLDFAFTAVNVPYAALTAELTQDYDERTRLSSVRMSFSIIGGVLAAFFHGIIVSLFPGDPKLGYAISAAIWALFIAGPCFITFFGTREPEFALSAKPAAQGPGFLEGLRIALSNKAFILVTLIYMLSWLAIQFAQNNLQIFTKDWIKLDMQLFSFLLLAIQFSSFLWVLIWSKVSERIGKQNVYYLGAVFFVLALMGLFFLQPGQVVATFLLAAMAGIGISVGYLVPWSMVPDVVELDELQTGQRREGIFYGFFVFLQKMGLALGLFFSGWVLDLAGYVNAVPGQPDPVQPASALLALRVLIGPVSAGVLLLSFLAVRAYPITRERHAEICAELARRKAASAS